ncbi:MAG: redoxin domain-containing protein [Gemmataceae bacterium]|nr:redoxin domain-containing protein [Gemmataceae bacterium]MDW8266122.1 redoxin domain-containing protein [Gemmataceae bacterium]
MRSVVGFLPVWVVLTAGLAAGADGPSTARLGQAIENFTLTDADGKPWGLDRFKGANAIVVVFLSFECPLSKEYSPVLAELAQKYEPKGVRFLGISMSDETSAAAAQQARDFGLPFPVWADPAFKAVDALKAEVTPEAFVLDRQRVVRYRGRIDDTYSARLRRKPQTTRFDLRDAIDAVLAGRPVAEPATQAIGCPIHREEAAPKTGPVTFYRDVLPILRERCQTCHRPGEVGPFSLLTYKQALNWAHDIKEYTQSRQMPPWKPADGVPFRDERKLTDQEIAVLAAWVDGGAPEGDPKDAPPPRRFPQGWQLGTPDLILTPTEDFQLGPSGRDLFRCFVLPTNLPEDVYVQAVEVRPSNPRVVHHALLFIDTTGQARQLEAKEREKPKGDDVLDRGPGYTVAMGVGFLPRGALGGWAPGQMPHLLPEGTGYYLPKGADVVMQVHYHRDGRLEKDRTAIGLYFAKRPVQKRFQSVVLPGRFLFIPPGRERYPVTGSIWVEQDCDLHSVMPHMHLLGKEIKVTLTPPDGPSRTVIHIPAWDYNWQETYFFQTPLKVKAGTRLDVEAYYDNSDKNPNNPNRPPRIVTFGEQTTDEMCFVFFGATSDQPGRIKVRRDAPARAK